MKKNAKLLLAIILAATLLLGAVPFIASAETYGDLEYSVSEGEVTITGCNKDITGELIIPDTIEDYPVTAIGDNAFEGCEGLTEITIPENIKTIGAAAFQLCSSLETLNYNAISAKYDIAEYVWNKSSTKHEGDSPFYNLPNLKNINIGEKVEILPDFFAYGCPVTKIVIPDSVITIGNCFLGMNTSISEASLGKNVKHIGDFAFKNARLISISLPDGVTVIGNVAFANCQRLRTINIPDTVEEIGDEAFSFCKVASFSITTLDNIKTIGNYAFGNCSKLSTLTLPDHVIHIGARAFEGTPLINNSSYWEDDIFYIGKHMISDYKSMSDMSSSGKSGKIKSGTITIADAATSKFSYDTIPDTVIHIGAYFNTFYGNTIPKSVKSIGRDAFSYHSCNFNRNIYFEGTASEWCKIEFNSIGSVTYTTYNFYPYYSYPNNYYNLVISGEASGNIKLTDDINAIGDYTFSNCQSINSMVIPDSVTSIGKEAFKNCSNMTEIYLGKNVSSIDEEAFNGCKSLKTVYITSDNITIDQTAFYQTNHPAFIVKKGNPVCDVLTEKGFDVVTFDTDDTYKPDGEKEAMPVLSFHGELKFGTELSEMILSKLVKDADKDICFAYFESLDFSEYPEFVDALKNEGFDMEDMEYRFEDLIVGIKLFDSGVRFMPLKEGEDDGPMNIFEAIGKFIMEQIFIPLAAGLKSAVAFVMKLFKGK